MPFPLSQLSTSFLNNMVFAMYRYEAVQVYHPDLLTLSEEQDFYAAYMGYPL